MLLFILVIAPTVFTVLDEINAGLLLRKLFPRMFLFGFAILFLSIIAAFQADRSDLINLSLISALGFIFNAFYLAPLINKKRDELIENHMVLMPALSWLTVFLCPFYLTIDYFFDLLGYGASPDNLVGRVDPM